MDYRQLGGSGFMVPALTLGTGTFGGGNEFFKPWGATGRRGGRRASSTSASTPGSPCSTARTCTRTGWPRRSSARRLPGVATGCSSRPRRPFAMATGRTTSARRGSTSCAPSTASLRRLGTDYIDLFQLHGFDALTPVEEALGTLDDLVRAGKIRYIGASNFSGWHLMKSLAVSERYGLARYVAHQAYYSLVGREYEWELMPLGLDQKVGAVVWSPLGWARLTGKIRRGQPRPDVSRLQDKRNVDAGPQVADEYLYCGRRRARCCRGGDGQDGAADRAQLAAPAADGRDHRHRRAQRRAAAAEPRCGWVESHARAGRQARCRERGDANLPVLAPAGVRRAQSVSHRVRTGAAVRSLGAG